MQNKEKGFSLGKPGLLQAMGLLELLGKEEERFLKETYGNAHGVATTDFCATTAWICTVASVWCLLLTLAVNQLNWECKSTHRVMQLPAAWVWLRKRQLLPSFMLKTTWRYNPIAKSLLFIQQKPNPEQPPSP